ncbi:MAG: GAF domain-containing protein [Chloroflexota bacterium]
MRSKPLPFNLLIPVVLGLLTLAVLALNPPDQLALISKSGILIAYSLLAALTINFGIIVDDVELSPIHGVGVMLLLSLPRSAFPSELWVIALASIVGELVYSRRFKQASSLSRLVTGVARITLSFYAAGLIYQGALPLTDVVDSTLFPVLLYGFSYGAISLLLFLIEAVSKGDSIRSLRPRIFEIVLLLVLPIPFSVLAAVIYNRLSTLLFAIYLASLALVLLRLYEIALAQRRTVEAISSTQERELYAQQKERVSQLVTLNRILALLTDTLSPETVLDTIISSASTIGDSSAVAVYLFSDGKAALARSAGLSAQFQTEPPVPIIVAKAGTPPTNFQESVVVGNVTSEIRAAALRPTMQREGKAAWIELPLVFQGVRLGILVIYYDAPRDFSPEMIELLRTFANQCAQAISNARLYAITDEALERRVGQLLALASIGHHLTATLEVRAICDLVAEYAQETTTANAAAILLFNPAGGIEQGSLLGYPDAADRQKLLSKSVTAQALSSKDTVMISDVQPEPGYEGLLPGARAQLTTPILWNEAVVGVIALESVQSSAFSGEDSYFVKQLANQAIIAIENARLFRKVSEARDRVQLILNTVKEALILISTSGEVVLANPRVALLGLNPDDLIGSSVDGLLSTSLLGLAGRLGFRTGGEIQRLVKELRAPGGLSAREAKNFTVEVGEATIYIERQVFPVYDEHEKPLGVLLVFYDESEEMRLAKTREEFSQMLVHDLRSPLTAVTTALKLLTELTPKNSEFRPLVETTTDASRRAINKLLNRVDSLLDVSRMESGLEVETQPTELSTLVDNVCVELSPLAQELSISLKPIINADLPLLEIDADKVERLLLNLMDNALKFSPSDSQVTVRAHEPGAEGAAPGFVRIDVIDAGPGVPDEYKLLLFDRFVQVRGRQGTRRGTGLGLTFCRLVTETHGGRIWIDDNPAGGSIFSFTLPVALENESVGSD